MDMACLFALWDVKQSETFASHYVLQRKKQAIAKRFSHNQDAPNSPIA